MTVYKIILLKVKIQYSAFSLNRSTYSTLFYFVFFFFPTFLYKYNYDSIRLSVFSSGT